jgi:hypothetical protein
MPAGQVFDKWKHGQLHSGSKKGPVVKSHAQATAIFLSEKRAEGQHGGKYPERQMGGQVGPQMPPPMGLQGPGARPGMAAGLGGMPHGMPPTGAPRPGMPPPGLGRGFQFGGSPTSTGLTPGWIERQEAHNSSHVGPIMSTVGGRTDNHAINVPSGSYVLPAAHVSALGQGNTLNGMQILQNMFGPPMKTPHGAGPPRPPGMMKPPAMPGLPAVSANGGGVRADGGNVISFPSRATLFGKELSQSPDQVAQNRTNRILSQVLQKPNVLPIGPDDSDRARGGRSDKHLGRPVPIMASGGEYVLSPEQVAKVGRGDVNHGHAVLDAWVKHTHKKYAKTIANLPPPAKS